MSGDPTGYAVHDGRLIFSGPGEDFADGGCWLGAVGGSGFYECWPDPEGRPFRIGLWGVGGTYRVEWIPGRFLDTVTITLISDRDERLPVDSARPSAADSSPEGANS